MTTNNDLAIIVTGKLHNEILDKLINTYKNVKHKILSTWDIPSYNEMIEKLKDMGFIIVLNNFNETKKLWNGTPNTFQSTISQTITIQNGLIKAKELGYKYVIRSRTDITCNDSITFNRFINSISYLYIEKLSVICGVGIGKRHYFLDFIIAGDINELLLFFYKIPDRSDKHTPPESYWLREYFKNKYPEKSINGNTIKETFNYFLNELKKNDIEFMWYKTNHPRYAPYTIDVVNEYCNRNCMMK